MDNLNYTQLTPEEKEYIVAEAFNSKEGMTVLASSMANPIRYEMDYYAIGRKLLVVDPLPQGVDPIYDKDIRIPATIIGKRGQAPDTIVEGERFTLPTFDIVVYPQARYNEIKTRRYNLVDRIQTRARLDLTAIEDQNIFNAINFAAVSGVNPVTLSGTALTKTAITRAMGEIGKWDLRPSKILMNYSEYVDLINLNGLTDLDPVHQHEIIETGLIARFMGLDILVSKMIPRGSIFVLAEQEYVGVMPIRQDINVIPADKPEKLRIGFVIYENIGIGIVNPRAVARITVSGRLAYTPWNLQTAIPSEAQYGPFGQIN